MRVEEGHTEPWSEGWEGGVDVCYLRKSNKKIGLSDEVVFVQRAE